MDIARLAPGAHVRLPGRTDVVRLRVVTPGPFWEFIFEKPGGVGQATLAESELSAIDVVDTPSELSFDADPTRFRLGVNPSVLRKVSIEIIGIPASKTRDVIKVAALPFAKDSATVSVDMKITADGGAKGIPRETLSLVVLEGLRQLGLEATTVETTD